jgi:hypothetical protein
MTILGDALRWVGKQVTTARKYIGKHVIDPIVNKLSKSDIVKEIWKHSGAQNIYDLFSNSYSQLEEALNSGGDLSKIAGLLTGSRTVEKLIDKLRGKGLSNREILDAIKKDVDQIQFGLSMYGSGGKLQKASNTIGNIQEGADVIDDIYKFFDSSSSEPSSQTRRSYLPAPYIDYSKPLRSISSLDRPTIQLGSSYDESGRIPITSDATVIPTIPTITIPRAPRASDMSQSDGTITIPRPQTQQPPPVIFSRPGAMM